MRKFKHKITNDIVISSCELGYYKNVSIPMGTLIPGKYIENCSDWEEILDLPVGTKIIQIRNTESIKETSYEKTKEGWYFGDLKVWIDESDIGEGKKFQILKEKPKKDWEILSFTNSSGDMFYLNNQGYYDWSRDKQPATWRTLEYMLKVAYCKIKSVKRLSDGEIFTLGDETKNGKITEFFINEENQTLFVKSNKPKWDYCSTVLKYCEKANPVLFITEDGKEIYKNNEFWVVYENKTLFESSTFILNSPNHENGLYKYFSTKEAAENYIFCNKSVLSFNDVWNISNNKFTDNSFIVISKQDLKNLVKSKI